MCYNNNCLKRLGRNEFYMSTVNGDCNIEVELFYAVVDKSEDLKVVDFDSHFSELSGVHPSKIKQGKLSFLDMLKPCDREKLIQKLCSKNRYIYTGFEILKNFKEPVYVYCICENISGTNLCRIMMSEVEYGNSKKSLKLIEADDFRYSLADEIICPVCLFRVDDEMQTEAFYMNKSCCRLFETTQEAVKNNGFRIDLTVADDDKTLLFQSIGTSLATGEPIDMYFHIYKNKFDIVRCRLRAEIAGYDKETRPVFNAVIDEPDDISQSAQYIFKNRAEVLTEA